MRQDEIIIQAFSFLKTKNYLAANDFIILHYPRIERIHKPLVIEAERLGFNTSPIDIEDRSVSIYSRKTFTELEKDSIFLHDFYQCRYSGLKLFSPPVLAVISIYLADTFPCYKIPHFPLDNNHQGIYTLYPSPDHIVSLYAGGSNDVTNIVTSSSTLNMIKGQYTNVEMGWHILGKSELDTQWDGGRAWFLNLINDKEEFEQIIAKALVLGTFHKRINPASYFNKWADAFYKNDTSKNRNISGLEKSMIKESHAAYIKKEIINTLPQSKDLKDLPVGTISRNKGTNNRYVTLKKENNELTYFSEKENFALKIKTKPLSVKVEFIPEFKVLSIVELPTDIYNDEQLAFIKKACTKLCNGNHKNLALRELPLNTIYQYLLNTH